MSDEAFHDLLDRAIPDLPARLTPPGAATIRRYSRRRRTRATAVVAAVTVLAVVGAAVAGSVLRGSDEAPVGGAGVTELTLQAVTADGDPPSADDLNRTAALLSHRFAAFGRPKTTARVQDGSHIVVVAAARQPEDVLRRLIAPGVFQMRLVLGQTPGGTAGPSTAPTVFDALTGTLDPTVPRPTLQQVRAKLGAAYDLAAQAIEPDSVMQDGPGLQPLASLTAAEVAALPVSMQYGVPRIGCDQLLGGLAAPADQRATKCGSEIKYLLEPAAIVNADVSGATASGQELVVSFVNGGQERWTNLTRVAYAGGVNSRQIAVLLDGTVLAAPTIQAVNPADAEIQPMLTAADTRIVATLLNEGPLPTYLTVTAAK
jgi:preprotein translocase subunit SecD